MEGSDAVTVLIPSDLVARYPSTELNPRVRNWCLEHFVNPFSIIRIREDKCHNGIAYWVHGAALVGSSIDIVLFALKFLPDTSAGILQRLTDDPYWNDPDYGSW
jgi:hypothetical protein